MRHHETHFDNIFFMFPVSQIKTKTIQNKPFQHSMIFRWVFLMHKLLTRPRHYSSSSRFVWSWWAQNSSLQGYYATVLPIKEWKKMQFIYCTNSKRVRWYTWWSCHTIIKSLFAIGRPSNKQRPPMKYWSAEEKVGYSDDSVESKETVNKSRIHYVSIRFEDN